LILIVTHSKDVTADFVIRHLLARGLAYLRLDTDKLGRPECCFGFGGEAELHLAGRVVRQSDITAIWARRFAVPDVLGEVEPAFADFARRELAVAMDSFLEVGAGILQINSSQADRLAGNRLIQSHRARGAGFATPETLVTQDVAAARNFLDAHPSAICKALSFGRLSAAADSELVAFASPASREMSLEGLCCGPVLLQERIDKSFDWRVTTVGGQAFSARLAFDPDRQPIDWRQDRSAGMEFEPAEPPAEIVDRLLRLTRDSGLVYGAHDLVETPEGDFFFLETNPAGQWGWLELTAGLPIGRAIADALAVRTA
jgi:glutathione synthase/RimK-type ligase-like ATP-grasp enzyme